MSVAAGDGAAEVTARSSPAWRGIWPTDPGWDIGRFAGLRDTGPRRQYRRSGVARTSANV